MIVQTMTADIRHCARLRKINNVTHLSWRGKDLLSSFDDNIIAALIELLINIPVKKGTKTWFLFHLASRQKQVMYFYLPR